VGNAHRHKLLNWLCSMSLLLLVCTLALVLTWRTIVVVFYLGGTPAEIDRYAGPLAMGLMAYFMFFPALACWHFFDLIESDRRPDRWTGWLSRYRSFARLIVLASPLAILSAVDGVAMTGCGGVFQNSQSSYGFIHGCPRPGNWDVLLVLFVGPLVAFACVSKAVTSLLSLKGSGK
jgi:hypothetical protein